MFHALQLEFHVCFTISCFGFFAVTSDLQKLDQLLFLNVRTTTTLTLLYVSSRDCYSPDRYSGKFALFLIGTGIYGTPHHTEILSNATIQFTFRCFSLAEHLLSIELWWPLQLRHLDAIPLQYSSCFFFPHVVDYVAQLLVGTEVGHAAESEASEALSRLIDIRFHLDFHIGVVYLFESSSPAKVTIAVIIISHLSSFNIDGLYFLLSLMTFRTLSDMKMTLIQSLTVPHLPWC